jgi:hypothetical protein
LREHEVGVLPGLLCASQEAGMPGPRIAVECLKGLVTSPARTGFRWM